MAKKLMKKFLTAITGSMILFFGVNWVSAGEVLNVPMDHSNIEKAMVAAGAGDTVLLSNGKYRENVIVKNQVTLKAKNRYKAEINGKGRGVAVTLLGQSSIIGCEITNATIGVFSQGTGCEIRHCRIVQNWMTGIIAVRHLPVIEDNIIAFNRASGFQGWDVRSTSASINHNTIAYNANHGIAVGGESEIVVENNTIAYNERYGFKFSDETMNKSDIRDNNFYKNLPTQDIPGGNHSFEPAFQSPRKDYDFRPDPNLCCSVKGSDNKNLGVRYE